MSLEFEGIGKEKSLRTGQQRASEVVYEVLEDLKKNNEMHNFDHLSLYSAYNYHNKWLNHNKLF